jgi:hypothetical protein
MRNFIQRGMVKKIGRGRARMDADFFGGFSEGFELIRVFPRDSASH